MTDPLFPTELVGPFTRDSGGIGMVDSGEIVRDRFLLRVGRHWTKRRSSIIDRSQG